MGKSVRDEQFQKQEDDQNYEERQIISPQQYEPFQHSNQSHSKIKNKNKYKSYHQKKTKRKISEQYEDYDQVSFQHKRKKKKPKKIITQQQINARDIIDIIVIILLVLILGVSLFRVMLEVQVQYKMQDQRNNLKRNRKNNPNQNYQKNKKNQGNSSISTSSKNNTLPKEVKFNVSVQCRNYISNLLQEKGHLYDFHITYEQIRQKSNINSFKQAMNTQISKQQLSDAIDLIGLVHHTEFGGQLKVKQDPCQKIQTKKQRLQKLINKQNQEWNSIYDVDMYHYRQLRFCLVVNSYNNAKNGLIYRNIDSILQQNYTNYHVIYTDDNSNDLTAIKVRQYLVEKNVPQNLFFIRVNEEQKGMMENIYTAIHIHCKNGQIAVMIDGDDSFIGTNVLSLLNAVYQKEKPALMWGNFVTVFNNQQINLGFSRDYPPKNKKQGSFRKVRVFITSHLKTFFVDVFKKIVPSDLQTNNGNFFRGASDTAMMLPMIEMANPRIKYLPQLLYEYRYDTGQSGNAVNKIPQKEALKKIYSSSPYKKLTDFSFVEKAIQDALDLSQKYPQQTFQKKNQVIYVNTSSVSDPNMKLIP